MSELGRGLWKPLFIDIIHVLEFFDIKKWVRDTYNWVVDIRQYAKIGALYIIEY